MSPVCRMKLGFTGSALILSTAAFNVAATSGLAGLLKPMWLSLIWTKLSSPRACFPVSPESPLRLYDLSTPPCITQKAPVPAQAMHFKNPRRSMPSWLWSCRISSFGLSAIASSWWRSRRFWGCRACLVKVNWLLAEIFPAYEQFLTFVYHLFHGKSLLNRHSLREMHPTCYAAALPRGGVLLSVASRTRNILVKRSEE